MTLYANTSQGPVTLASGQPLAPGETGEPDFTTDHDRALKDDGLLTRAADDEPKSKRKES